MVSAAIVTTLTGSISTSQQRANLADSCVGVENVIKAVSPRFLFPFQRKESGEVVAPQKRCCCCTLLLLLLLLLLIYMTSALRRTFNKNAQQSLRQLIELSKLVEAIPGSRGSILKSAFPALCCPNSFFPAHRVPHTPADVPWAFSFSLSPPSNRIQIPQPEFFPAS